LQVVVEVDQELLVQVGVELVAELEDLEKLNLL
jgi:hypothetical protein